MISALGRYWIYRHGGTRRSHWRTIAQTDDEADARRQYGLACDAMRQGGIRLVDIDANRILEERTAPRLRSRW
jgi:hypothetical protein